MGEQRGSEQVTSRARVRRQVPRGAGVAREVWEGQPAVIYCRISHVLDDDQTGVDRQERLCREVATRLGLVVARVFVDNNRSAWQRTRKRPGWDAMLETIREGGCRHVITYHPDRLMRQPKDLEELLTISDDVGVTLHGQANRRDLSDPDDRFMLRIEVAHACRSSDDTSRRLRDAMVERAQEGIAHTGTRAYGYEPDNVTIREDEAAIVREVFARYLDGETPGLIARDLNERGVPTTRGAAWTDGAVRVLLRSRHVAGIRVFRGQDYGRGTWPAIIEEGMWREVQDRLAYRAAAITNRATRYYLLRGLVVCKRCGTVMSGSRNNGGWSYQCTRTKRMDEGSCSRRIGAIKLEEFVVDAALTLLTGLTVTGTDTTVSLSETEQAAITADETELAELKDMWHARELTTREYREMRRVVDDRITHAQRKTVVRPAVEVLDGLTGPHAHQAWAQLAEAEEYERMNAILRFLFAAVIIDESHAPRGSRFDYSRIDIESNPL